MRPPAAQVRDSAGVQIVENTGYQWPGGHGWRLSDAPLLDIGVLEGDPDYQLYRVTGALRLGDGRLVVANAGANELRFYDSTGTYLSTSGARGGGPGEFEGLTWLSASASDSLLAYDWRNRRISVFDAGGKFIRGFTLRALSHAPPSHSYGAALGDGSLLIAAQAFFAAGQVTTGVYRDTVFHLLFDKEGVLADTIGRHPGAEMYIAAVGEHLDVLQLPFGCSPHTTPFLDGFYFGRGDSYQIGYFAATGKLERIIRRPQASAPVRPADIESYTERQLAGVTDENERLIIESVFEGMPFPETMPAYHDLLADAEGNLWVEEYRRPGDDQPRWTVFDPNGVMLGIVATPPDFQVYQIGYDFVLGRWTDDLDVEHVRLYELIRE
ncbi:MAG: hypothetical protein JSV86_02605 [Gemmatimonadota bacterium]|nr:MAG: hypothetical protein JSV86_02605 [Gemmatimonadota bacterium]